MAQTEHPRTYWETYRATSTELGGAREIAGCLGVQSPGKDAGSPEGKSSRRWARRFCPLGLPVEQVR